MNLKHLYKIKKTSNVTINYISNTQPPANVEWILADSENISFKLLNNDMRQIRGYQIRAHSGINYDWSSAITINNGNLVTTTPLSTPDNIYGESTFLIKAINLNGIYSANATSDISPINSPSAINVLSQFNQAQLGWNGITTGGSVDNYPKAYSLSSVVPDFSSLTYECVVNVSDISAGSRILISFQYNGSAITAEYRQTAPKLMWTNDMDPMWTNDSDLLWSLGDYLTWPGYVIANQATYNFRLSIPAGSIQGKIMDFVVIVDAPDIIETLTNVAISVNGTRLPITNTYRSIKDVQISINNVNIAARAEVIDMSIDGPMVKCFDINNNAIDGNINAIITGY